MPQVCLYLQLHQPYRLRDFSIFELGKEREYFFEETAQGNKATFQKVAHKSYLPMLRLLLSLTQKFPEFCFAFSCSGVFLDQAQEYEPEVIALLKKLVKTGQVEVLAETYYHSLAALYSPTEFFAQVAAHQEKVHELFGVYPNVFRNTELIYSNAIAELVANFGFAGMITEAVPRYMHGRHKTQVFQNTTHQLPLLLKHAELSDDIAFRFSNKDWQWYPLTVEKYLDWVEVYPENEIVNLFMDFETFGEHQWESTGIFEFFAVFVERFLGKSWNHFHTPSQIFDDVTKRGAAYAATLPVYDVPYPISWADVDRDLTAWIDNDFQKDTIAKIYELEKAVQKTKDVTLINDWRKLQTSDHFYYMCTKWSADGDVHAYFSPYKSPFEAYRRYSIVLADLYERLL